MQKMNSRQMTIVVDDDRHTSVTEVVKLPVNPENLQRMMDYVQEWHETIIPGLPGFQGAALLSSPAGAVFVYANWSSKRQLRKRIMIHAWVSTLKGSFPCLQANQKCISAPLG
jgi:hypothetical protein